jgi:hypothetical protein
MKNLENFQTAHYQRHNQRRQEQLATLALPISGKTVLEVGAGVGDHTHFFLDRNCKVTSTDGRTELVEIVRKRYPNITVEQWNVELSIPKSILPHQIIYCFGLLYHVQNPELFLNNIAPLTTEMLLLETCVSWGESSEINPVEEVIDDPTQSLNGKACRPTRSWIFNKLKSLFPYVYLTKTQPWHEEFPLDWTVGKNPHSPFSRSVFVASRQSIANENLSETLLMHQVRC